MNILPPSHTPVHGISKQFMSCSVLSLLKWSPISMKPSFSHWFLSFFFHLYHTACSQCRRHKRCGFDPWVGKIPWRRKWQTTPVFLPGEARGQRSLAGYSLWSLSVYEWMAQRKIWTGMQQNWRSSVFGSAWHCECIASNKNIARRWKTIVGPWGAPWQRVGHNWEINTT